MFEGESKKQGSESAKEVASQFTLYTMFSICTTGINMGLQFILQFFMTLILAISIALAIGYTTKFFLDCYITFKNEKTEETNVKLQFAVYFSFAIGFYFINLILQLAFLEVGRIFLTDVLLLWLFSFGVSTVIVFGVKFLIDKYFTFKMVGQKRNKS